MLRFLMFKHFFTKIMRCDCSTKAKKDLWDYQLGNRERQELNLANDLKPKFSLV